jgi:hypothetical protein
LASKQLEAKQLSLKFHKDIDWTNVYDDPGLNSAKKTTAQKPMEKGRMERPLRGCK